MNRQPKGHWVYEENLKGKKWSLKEAANTQAMILQERAIRFMYLFLKKIAEMKI